jgi:hypothetical protein
MNREEIKCLYQLEVFSNFLDRSLLPIDRVSIKCGNPDIREPDIVCKDHHGNIIGFELGRFTDPNLAQAINRWEPRNGEPITTTDPCRKITLKKIQKTYNADFPIDLLLYIEQPIITPDDVIVPTIESTCQIEHKYSKVWFMGDTIKILYECNK